MDKLFLTLLRITKKEAYTEGALFNKHDNDAALFDTLEDRIRDINGDGDLDDEGEGKVYAETAIPFSKPNEPYELEVTWSPKFQMDMVLVKNVPSFTGIRLHWGRTAVQSHGCILGGERTGPGVLGNTGFTKYMVDLLNEYGGKARLEVI